jgi:anti-anti-sigma factor
MSVRDENQWPDCCQYVEKNERCQVILQGDLDVMQAVTIKAAFQKFANEPRPIEINLSHVTSIDTAVIQLLMALRQYRTKQDLTLQLTNHSDAVLAAYSLLDLVSYFNDPIVMTRSGAGQ